jgi:hypothetical protein
MHPLDYRPSPIEPLLAKAYRNEVFCPYPLKNKDLEWNFPPNVGMRLEQTYLMKTPNAQTKRSHPSTEQIAARAHEIWEASGRPQGCDLNHWLQAEAELTTGQITKIHPKQSQPQLKAAA